MRLAAAIEEFVVYKRALGASYKGENNRLLAFLRATGDLQLKSITKQHIDAHLPIPGSKNREQVSIPLRPREGGSPQAIASEKGAGGRSYVQCSHPDLGFSPDWSAYQ